MDGKIIHLERVDSTNLYCKRGFDSLADGTVVYADTQTAGRGRLGRKWVSPPDCNFYGSAVFKQCFDGFGATMTLSLATLDTLRELAPQLDVYIKWPNDIFYKYFKLAGMLCEGVLDNHNRFVGIIAGIGVNLNMTEHDLAAIGQPAASVFSITKQRIIPDFFARKLAFYLNRRYIIYLNSPESVFSEWRKENRLIGQPVKVVGFNGPVEGRFHDVAASGEMLLDTVEGIKKINSGDLSIDKASVKAIYSGSGAMESGA